jgi:peptidoglycan/xylan/chitin deacetylase (PgdA/CDA1 family)
MKLSQFLSLSLTVAGGLASIKTLTRRQQAEQANNRAAICIDYVDAYSASIRAGMTFADLLHELAHHGATHVSLPELSLNRLLRSGELTPRVPTKPRTTQPPIGHWNYLYGEANLIQHLAEELSARLSYTSAEVISKTTLVFAGEMQTIGEIGLGFDLKQAATIINQHLQIVPRPISYAWPEQYLIERTLTQAAALGTLIAFDGNMILGHEMHLSETLDMLEQLDLSFVYFAESRHQKGDWFIAKRRAPKVVLAHRFTPEEMIPLDFHAAAHQWGYLARERGIRFCYVNFFKVLHATDPLEALHYVEHIKEELEENGLEVTGNLAKVLGAIDNSPVQPSQGSKKELALTGLASAGVVSSALNNLLNVPEPLATALVITSAAGALTLPYLEKARGHLEEQYPPSYAPKLIALAAASLAPVAAHQAAKNDRALGLLSGVLMNAASAVAVAAATSDRDYRLRIEDYRGFNLDWLLPLASAALSIQSRALRLSMLAALGGAWWIANQRHIDPLALIDPAHAEGHTHHLSTFARTIGDVKIAIGPRPARKWTAAGPIGLALSRMLIDRGNQDLSALAGAIGSIGYALGLVGFRRSERSILITSKEAGQSLAIGTALSLLISIANRRND